MKKKSLRQRGTLVFTPLSYTVGSAGAAALARRSRASKAASQQATAAVLAGVLSINTTTRPLRVWSESPFTHLHDLPPHGPSVMIVAGERTQ